MATGDLILFDKFKEFSIKGGTSYPVDFDTNDIRLMLVKATYTPDYAAHDYRDDVTAHECSGSNYTASGVALANKVVTLAASIVTWDADNVTWAQHATGFADARYGILVKITGGASSTDPLIGLLDLGTTRGNVSGDLTINWNASGIIRFQ